MPHDPLTTMDWKSRRSFGPDRVLEIQSIHEERRVLYAGGGALGGAVGRGGRGDAVVKTVGEMRSRDADAR